MFDNKTYFSFKMESSEVESKFLLIMFFAIKEDFMTFMYSFFPCFLGGWRGCN